MSVKLKCIFDEEYAQYLKEGKEEANMMHSAIKANKNLSDYWLIVENLMEGECEPESVSTFINESISMISKVDMTAINEMASKFPDPEYSPLESAINTVLFEEKSPKTIQRFIDANAMLYKHLVGNRERREKMETLTESLALLNEHKIIKEYLDSPDRPSFLESKRTQAVDYLQGLLREETDPENRLLIYENMNKVQTTDFNDENFIENILAIDELIEG